VSTDAFFNERKVTQSRVEIGLRKIQKMSKAHYVNLPGIWMHNNNAKQGDCVLVQIEPNGSLRISIAPVTPSKVRTGASQTTTS
jgi:antitoxin component of MazEF toxin-antitoxin module